jgi:hypothetical protein
MDDLFTLDMPNSINENEIISENDIQKFKLIDTQHIYEEIKRQADKYEKTNFEGGSINFNNIKLKKKIINNFDIGNNNTLEIFKTKY